MALRMARSAPRLTSRPLRRFALWLTQLAYEGALAPTVTASSTDVAACQAVTLTANEPNVTCTTTTGAIISGDIFVASQPGSHTITASNAAGTTATSTVKVYGAAAAVQVAAKDKNLVAIDAAATTVTASVVSKRQCRW